MVLSCSRYALRSALNPSLSNVFLHQQPTSLLRSAATAGTTRFFSKEGAKNMDKSLETLFKKNREWVETTNKEDPTFFEKLGSGQAPDYLYIGCSDSRVSVEKLLGVGMGELFVHRNVANLVVSTDLNFLSVLTYAVEYLKVKHIIVAGHYDCGGVRAAMSNNDYGPVLDAWVQNIRDVYRLHQEELDGIEDDECRHRRLVELNVAEQCLNIYKTPVVQKKRYQTHADPNLPCAFPRVHGLVFNPGTGILNRIPIDYRKSAKELRSMYDLFDEDDFKVDEEFAVKKKKPN